MLGLCGIELGLWLIMVQIDYFQGMFDEEMHSMLDIALCLGLVEIGFNQLSHCIVKAIQVLQVYSIILSYKRCNVPSVWAIFLYFSG